MHPLDGANQRVKRAGVHLVNLNKRINVFAESIRNDVVINRKPGIATLPDGKQTRCVLGNISMPLKPVPDIIRILIGEIIYNLRAGLDYLVYELARSDSGEIQDGTQFPIDDNPKIFKERQQGFLKGISDEHVAIIQNFQPCYGCEWTKLLRQLSNPDKHRKLTLSKSSVEYRIPLGSTEAILNKQPVNMKDGLVVHIILSHGKTIVDVETLKQLKSNVADVLHLFRSQIK